MTDRSRAVRALALSAFLLAAAGARAEIISGGGREMFDVRFLNADETSRLYHREDNDTYTYTPALKKAVLSGYQYWADILGPGAKNDAPVPVYVRGLQRFANANAGQHNYADGRSISNNGWVLTMQNGGSISPFDITKAKWQRIEGTPQFGYVVDDKVLDKYGAALVTFGDNYGALREGSERGWWLNDKTLLPDNEQASDLGRVARHELAHALGIAASRSAIRKNGVNQKDEDGRPLYRFATTETPDTVFYKHLIDERGNRARPGMEIITPEEFERRKKADQTLNEKDFFILSYVRRRNLEKGSTKGKAYFLGASVSEVLDGATFDGVAGVPINGWENYPELAHIELGGTMSHADYRNWTTFNEAELAVMQDIGWKFDRKAYYGYSVYKDGATITNTRGFSARNAEGTAYLDGVPSTVPLAIGLHVWGSGNTVTQAADILTKGTGSAGMRIDGAKNRIILAEGKKISADGENGIGALFSYGGGHIFEQKGDIAASGKGGIGARFDFGSNSRGAGGVYYGSYINYKRRVDVKTGKIIGTDNVNVPDELNAPLVSRYDVSGKLSGAAHAIYIGKNAFVSEINLKDGAEIKGNITSDWRHFNGFEDIYDNKDIENGSPLLIQYGDSIYNYSMFLPDLVTELNVTGDASVEGSITGLDNMELNVKSGTLSFDGTARVTSVEVGKNGALFGGTYIARDVSQALPDGMTDDKTGVFDNAGLLIPAGEDMSITAERAFISNGSMAVALKDEKTAWAIVVKSPLINVEGTTLAAEVDGAYQPGVKYTFLKAIGEGIGGEFATKQGDEFTDLLDVRELKNEGDSAWVMLGVDDDDIEDEDERVVLSGLEEMIEEDDADEDVPGKTPEPEPEKEQKPDPQPGEPQKPDQQPEKEQEPDGGESGGQQKPALSPGEKKAVRTLFSQKNGRGVQTLSDIADNEAAAAAALTMRRERVGSAVASRAGWLNELPPLEPKHAHFGYKAEKDWDRFGRGAIKGSGSAFTLGADWAGRSGWTWGVLGQYGRDSWGLSSSQTSMKVRDWRLGLYAVNRTGPNELLLHAAIGRQTHENSETVLRDYVTESRYHSATQELGVRYSRDLTPGKTWHFRPFAQLQLTRYAQEAFDQTGNAPWRLHSDSFARLYSSFTAGLSAGRSMEDGSFGFTIGTKRVLSGHDPAIWTRLVSSSRGYRLESPRFDRTLLVLSAQGEWTLSKCWTANFGLELEQGRHDRTFSAKAAFCLSW
ncbi:MAG: autotransporter domain-containing protein [Pyramidobacter sp.]|nr:autotransporter domain-containing protein [Pyramidobacter sp.]